MTAVEGHNLPCREGDDVDKVFLVYTSNGPVTPDITQTFWKCHLNREATDPPENGDQEMCVFECVCGPEGGFCTYLFVRILPDHPFGQFDVCTFTVVYRN